MHKDRGQMSYSIFCAFVVCCVRKYVRKTRHQISLICKLYNTGLERIAMLLLFEVRSAFGRSNTRTERPKPVRGLRAFCTYAVNK